MADRLRNPFSDAFETAFIADQLARGIADPSPYFRQKHDFIQLQALIDKGTEHEWEITIERWQKALDNYFCSEVSCYRSIAHLCSRFSAFYKHPVNQYGQPLGKPESKNGQAIEMMRRRYGSEDDSHRSDTPKSPHSLRLVNGIRR